MKLYQRIRRKLAALLIFCMVLCNVTPAMADTASATASTMQLAKTEGTVNVTNRTGKALFTMDNMKLYNGYKVGTEQSSYAWVDLDNSKAVKLDALSEMEIREKGKELELLLNSGNLFFNVTSPLAADETLNIRTSTMVTGIRGTSGWVKVINEKLSRVYILDGTVTAFVTDPVSGQRKSITLTAGDTADFVVYDQSRVGDKCDIILRRFTEDEVEGFVAVELMGNAALCQKIQAESGLDVQKIVSGAVQRLKADQAKVADAMLGINRLVSNQASNIAVDPVFVDSEAGPGGGSGSGGGGGGGGSGSGGSGSGSSSGSTDSGSTDSGSTDSGSTDSGTTDDSTTTTPGAPQPTSIAVTTENVADAVNTALNDDTVSAVTVTASTNAADNTLSLGTTTVPAGKTLTTESGIDVDVADSETLTVDGTMNVNGDLSNSGTIDNNSMNTLNVSGTLYNLPGGVINNVGRIIVNDGAGTLVNEDTLTNSGIIQATVEVGTDENAGTFTSNGGSVAKVVLNNGTSSVTGGEVTTADIYDGTFTFSGSHMDTVNLYGGTLKVTGGTIDTVNVYGGTLTFVGGTITTINLEDGTVELKGGTVENINQTGGTLDDGSEEEVPDDGTGDDGTGDDGTGDDETGDDGTGDDSGDSTPEAGTPLPKTLSVTDGAAAILEALNDSAVSGVTVEASGDASEAVLDVTEIDGGILIVPAGKTLTLAPEVTISVESGESVIINGVLEYSAPESGLFSGKVSGGGTVTNSGTIVLPSDGGLTVACDFVNSGTVERTLTVDGGSVEQNGGSVSDLILKKAASFTLGGGSIGTLTVYNSTGEISGGTITTLIMDNADDSEESTEVEMSGGKAETVELVDGRFEMIAGTVTNLSVTGSDSHLAVGGGKIDTFEQTAGSADVTGGTIRVLNCTPDDENCSSVYMSGGSISESLTVSGNAYCEISNVKMEDAVVLVSDYASLTLSGSRSGCYISEVTASDSAYVTLGEDCRAEKVTASGFVSLCLWNENYSGTVTVSDNVSLQIYDSYAEKVDASDDVLVGVDHSEINEIALTDTAALQMDESSTGSLTVADGDCTLRYSFIGDVITMGGAGNVCLKDCEVLNSEEPDHWFVLDDDATGEVRWMGEESYLTLEEAAVCSYVYYGEETSSHPGYALNGAYWSLEAAFRNLKEDDTYFILQNDIVPEDDSIDLEVEEGSVTLNLNGYELALGSLVVDEDAYLYVTGDEEGKSTLSLYYARTAAEAPVIIDGLVAFEGVTIEGTSDQIDVEGAAYIYLSESGWLSLYDSCMEMTGNVSAIMAEDNAELQISGDSSIDSESDWGTVYALAYSDNNGLCIDAYADEEITNSGSGDAIYYAYGSQEAALMSLEEELEEEAATPSEAAPATPPEAELEDEPETDAEEDSDSKATPPEADAPAFSESDTDDDSQDDEVTKEENPDAIKPEDETGDSSEKQPEDETGDNGEDQPEDAEDMPEDTADDSAFGDDVSGDDEAVFGEEDGDDIVADDSVSQDNASEEDTTEDDTSEEDNAEEETDTTEGNGESEDSPESSGEDEDVPGDDLPDAAPAEPKNDGTTGTTTEKSTEEEDETV